jgi:aminoglycoside phosphotransferase
VDENDFDETRQDRSATSLLAELLDSRPDQEDVVFTHGDYCLPNIILRQSAPGVVEVSGFIDCGRAGIADRHQDLALAIRSVAFNFGADWVSTFLTAYGLAEPDARKVAFFTLLDEFF